MLSRSYFAFPRRGVGVQTHRTAPGIVSRRFVGSASSPNLRSRHDRHELLPAPDDDPDVIVRLTIDGGSSSSSTPASSAATYGKPGRLLLHQGRRLAVAPQILVPHQQARRS